ncbi:hypothetical protein [Bradyrhizobium sp. NBAIM08]|uniref:hypothetical protein n=1 Tax=Bradyrhizobium sp. NBAIM08 TaxID=2793815 RepID=UPI0034D22E1B
MSKTEILEQHREGEHRRSHCISTKVDWRQWAREQDHRSGLRRYTHDLSDDRSERTFPYVPGLLVLGQAHVELSHDQLLERRTTKISSAVRKQDGESNDSLSFRFHAIGASFMCDQPDALMRGPPHERDIEAIAREQRRETPTTIRQYVSIEWRDQTAFAKNFTSIALERTANGVHLVQSSASKSKKRLVCQLHVRQCLEDRHRTARNSVKPLVFAVLLQRVLQREFR